MKEYRQIIEYSCGHAVPIYTLGYKPEVDKRLVCGKCYLQYLLGNIEIPQKAAMLHIEQNTRILMSWLAKKDNEGN